MARRDASEGDAENAEIATRVDRIRTPRCPQ